MHILVTGGAGYIGSHTCIELLARGHTLLVLDNLSNSSPVALQRVERIVGRSIPFVEADITDAAALDRVFDEHDFDAVVHFAGLKAVGESVEQPLRYYHNNVEGSLHLFSAMARHNVFRIVFSSSATVYGDPATVPIREDFPLSATNPYGRCKLMIEEILRDLHVANDAWRIALLRYFNPVGAHASGTIGEDPSDIPNNLMPFVAQVAVGKREQLAVFGGDYPTVDGTGVRDYIHVVDLARGHVAAIDWLEGAQGLDVFNLGTGTGTSVLEMVAAFETASGRQVPYQIVDRRPGDIATCFADPAKAEQVLGWRAECDIEQMVADAWRWQSGNPDGYRS